MPLDPDVANSVDLETGGIQWENRTNLLIVRSNMQGIVEIR